MKQIFTLLTGIWLCNLSAQVISPEIVSSSGAIFQGQTIQLDWTLGEIAITSINNSSVQVTQGFHQPNFLITKTIDYPKQIGEIKVYPNPTSDRIVMDLKFEKNRKVVVRLMTINGQTLKTTELDGLTITDFMEISHLPSGNYFLNFSIDNNAYSSTYKIQKIN